ncbi:hypothetical protein MNBD_ALPHA12-1532 [hydrothermal vent metagenome]|uniref:Uncharacterized protein n=1 Tax=hydrothermal vent metagenome TaxID=652676 RepID=A0A3B0USV2_9ZZZZ
MVLSKRPERHINSTPGSFMRAAVGPFRAFPGTPAEERTHTDNGKRNEDLASAREQRAAGNPAPRRSASNQHRAELARHVDCGMAREAYRQRTASSTCLILSLSKDEASKEQYFLVIARNEVTKQSRAVCRGAQKTGLPRALLRGSTSSP